MKLKITKNDIFFLLGIYLLAVALRLIPRLGLDPHLLTFHADIWYRLCLAQYLIDHGHLPIWDIRYLAYGHVPLWYNPWSIYFFAALHAITSLDLPTICSRLMPFIESLALIPIYFLCQELYNKRVAVIATLFLLLCPTYLFWTGISTLQSFTLFLMPITILLWIRFINRQWLCQNKWIHLIAIGLMLAANFMTHLSYFSHLIILFLVQSSLVFEKRSCLKDFAYLVIAVLISQLLTIFWWFPNNLYWWWSLGLTTSSGLTEGLKFIVEYGVSSALISHIALIGMILVCVRHKKNLPAFFLLPVFWTIFPFIESHNEGWLCLVNRLDLSWNNFFKPLEGFRFYPFLAQPLAVCVGLLADRIILFTQKQRNILRREILVGVGIALALVLFFDTLFVYDLPKRLRNAGVRISDIKAAQWFRVHSQPRDRIVADYYTSQMFAGICAGKALLGFLFPLKNAPIPYITEKFKVQKDICQIYQSCEANTIKQIMRRYGSTHLYISDKNYRHINFMCGEKVGATKSKLLKILTDSKDFKEIYLNEDIRIFMLSKKMKPHRKSIQKHSKKATATTGPRFAR